MFEIEYERKAMNGEEMPADLGWPDQVLFLSLRMLYEQYKKGIVSRDAASREKRELVNSYRIHKALNDLQEDTNNMWRKIEIASDAYAKNPSVETADMLYEAIYRAKRKG